MRNRVVLAAVLAVVPLGLPASEAASGGHVQEFVTFDPGASEFSPSGAARLVEALHGSAPTEILVGLAERAAARPMQGPGKVAIRSHLSDDLGRGPVPRDRVVQAGS
jgi:hypothetical protein